MAIGGGLSAGRSGLINSSAAMAVIGNNIANVSTVGFKGSRTEFADLISADAGGEVGKIGLGSRIGAVRTLFTQGPVESTGRSLDMAIDGVGFFVLRDGQGRVFTRAGNMQLTAEGGITNTLGLQLQGSPVDQTGEVSGGLEDVNVQGAASAANPTSSTTFKGNLKSDAATTTVPAAPRTMQQMFDNATFPTSLQVYDSLGAQHEMKVFFFKTGANTWDVRFAVDSSEVSSPASSTDYEQIGQTTLSFGGGGGLTSGTPASVSVTFAGANAQTISVDLEDMAQFSSPSGINFVIQDGFGAGGLTSLSVDPDGILSATFDNGQSRALYKLAIAHFSAPEALAPAGSQLFRETVKSGPAAVATAQTQGNGSIAGSALEQSNVQIAQEFIDLITQQRAFQANARVITASDQLLSDLINIIR